MKKVKKINGYLIVQFSDREVRELDGAIGKYGVIDAELYTGCLGIDRGAMEYDDADSLEVAVEQARGLDSEVDIDEGEEIHYEAALRMIGAAEAATETEPLGQFVHLPPEKKDSATQLEVYRLGMALSQECPNNDCKVYLNIFDMCRELDEQLPGTQGWPHKVLEMELGRCYRQLETMYMLNYAIRQYRREPENGGQTYDRT